MQSCQDLCNHFSWIFLSHRADKFQRGKSHTRRHKNPDWIGKAIRVFRFWELDFRSIEKQTPPGSFEYTMKHPALLALVLTLFSVSGAEEIY